MKKKLMTEKEMNLVIGGRGQGHLRARFLEREKMLAPGTGKGPVEMGDDTGNKNPPTITVKL